MQHSSGAHAKARNNDKARHFAISLCYLTVCAERASLAIYYLSIYLPTQPQAY